MKHTKKTLGTMLLSVAFLTSCADMDPLGFNAFEKPASIEGMEYLADYDALKEYKKTTIMPTACGLVLLMPISTRWWLETR